jgi:ketosteroid isomerase-like protein
MFQENLELMRRGFDHMVATGHPPWEMIDRRIEVHDHHSAEGATYRGHAGLWRWLADRDAAWERWSIEAQQSLDVGYRVVAILGMRVRGKGGLQVAREEAHVWTVRRGQAVRVDVFGSSAQALEAVGLRK